MTFYTRSSHWYASVFAISILSSRGFAHVTQSQPERTPAWSMWSFEPAVILPMLAAGALYGAGLRRLPLRMRRSAAYFWAGWLLLTIALVSPMHRWSSWLFSVHMSQHEFLMIGAAPLIVLGRPGLTILRAFPASASRRLTAWSARAGLAAAWRGITRPAVAWLVHAFVLWAWHIPVWFEATLHHEWIHAAQHASFLVTALWFWYSVFRAPRRVADYGWGVVNLFFTAVHTSVLGALITFAPRPWYPSYQTLAPEWGLSALEDQQIGGLIMWVPAGLVYILGALALLSAWLRAAPASGALLGERNS
jgi:putative membrane protein